MIDNRLPHKSIQGCPTGALDGSDQSLRAALTESGSHKPGVLVIALLYNTNGMATWCWEAAHGLKESGYEVVLLAAPNVSLPGVPEIPVIRLEPSSPSPKRIGRSGPALFGRIRQYLSASPDGNLRMIHSALAQLGITPAAYILNQSSLVDREVQCAQLVAAWAFPTHLIGYLLKVPTLLPGFTLTHFVRTALSTLKWWFSDWRGYRDASCVLPVTNALARQLRAKAVNVAVAHPGTHFFATSRNKDHQIRLLIAAVRLNEPRKRVLWMLDALRRLGPRKDILLQLAGEPDRAVSKMLERFPIPVEVLGRLQRSDLEAVMRKSHVFCFGSLLDDWGYVLVESMANGMLPVAPARAPFDEILGNTGALYKPSSKRDFVAKVSDCIDNIGQQSQIDVQTRAHNLFSRRAFSRSITDALNFPANAIH